MARTRLTLPLLLSLLAFAGAGPDETKEPPLQLVLAVDGGEEIAVRIGEPFRIGAARCTLRLEDHRVFALAGFRFHYPREFLFAADVADPDAQTWTFDGPCAQVLVIRAAAGVKPAELLRRTVDEVVQLSQAAVKRTPVKLALDGRDLAGVRLEGSTMGQRTVQEVYAFTAGGTAYVLALQDLPDEPDRVSPDARRARRMLERTFRFEAAGR